MTAPDSARDSALTARVRPSSNRASSPARTAASTGGRASARVNPAAPAWPNGTDAAASSTAPARAASASRTTVSVPKPRRVPRSLATLRSNEPSWAFGEREVSMGRAALTQRP
jgi:hypothetical protein